MQTYEVVERVMFRIGFVKSHTDKVAQVTLQNTYEQVFGRWYHRIYLQVHLKPDVHFHLSWTNETPTEEQHHNDRIWHLNRRFEDYVSFWDEQYSEPEVERHYEWITELLNFHLKGIKIPLVLDRFETESMRQYLIRQEAERPKREEEQRLREAERLVWLTAYPFVGDEGDYALVNTQWNGEKLIRLDRQSASAYAPYGGDEINTNLKPGKRRIDDIKEDAILLVFSPEQLSSLQQKYPVCRDKPGLLRILSQHKNELILKYVKPVKTAVKKSRSRSR